MVDVISVERSPSRIELSSKEQRKLLKLLDGVEVESLMPYDDRDIVAESTPSLDNLIVEQTSLSSCSST